MAKMHDRYYARKHLKKHYLDPRKLIFILGALAVLSLIGCIVTNVGSAKQDYLTQKAKVVKLENKKNHLTAHGDAIVEGRFDLYSHEKQLAHRYQDLTAKAYGNSSSLKDFNALKPDLIRYFGNGGYQQIKEQVVTVDGGKTKLLPSKNEEVQVTFSNYNSANQTVDVTIYTRYDTNNFGQQNKDQAAPQSIAYITTTYNFHTGDVSDTSIQTSSLQQ